MRVHHTYRFAIVPGQRPQIRDRDLRITFDALLNTARGAGKVIVLALDCIVLTLSDAAEREAVDIGGCADPSVENGGSAWLRVFEAAALARYPGAATILPQQQTSGSYDTDHCHCHRPRSG